MLPDDFTDVTSQIAKTLESKGFQTFNPNMADEGWNKVKSRNSVKYNSHRKDIKVGQEIDRWKDVFLHQLVKAKKTDGMMIQLRQKDVPLGKGQQWEEDT